MFERLPSAVVRLSIVVDFFCLGFPLFNKDIACIGPLTHYDGVLINPSFQTKWINASSKLSCSTSTDVTGQDCY